MIIRSTCAPGPRPRAERAPRKTLALGGAAMAKCARSAPPAGALSIELCVDSVNPSFRALTACLQSTVRRHEFDKGSPLACGTRCRLALGGAAMAKGARSAPPAEG
jgi:hypothetical protein